MVKAKYLVFILILFQTRLAGASTLEARGSDAIVCRDQTGHITKAELFDYYEGRVLRDIAVDFGAGSSGLQDGIESLLTRLGRISPLRVAEYRKSAEEFLRDAYFMSGQQFPDIVENDPVAVPIGCREEQVVLQKINRLPGERRYTVNKDIWDAMNGENQAGLVMHEILFAHIAAAKNNHAESVDSDLLRYFNEVLASSDEIAALDTDKKIVDLFKMISFYVTDVKRINFFTGSAEFYPNGVLKTARIVDGKSDISLYGQTVTIDGITFFEDGSIKIASLYDTPFKDPYTGLDFEGLIEFHPGGRIKEGLLKGYQQTYQDPRTGKSFTRRLKFDAKGELLSGSLSKVSQHNAYELYGYYGQAELNEKGLIANWTASYIEGWVVMGGYTVKCGTIGTQITFSEDGAIARAIWSGYCPVRVQNSSIKVRDKFPVEMKKNQHVRAMTPDNESGWIELLAGSESQVKKVKWMAREFKSNATGETVYPEIRFHEGDLDILASGYLFEKTRFKVAHGGERDFEAQTWVQLNQNGEVVDWKVQ